MLKSSFSAILILTLCMTCVGRAAVLQDDINTFTLLHGDSIVGTITPDDTSITNRTPVNMTINGGNAPIVLGTGVYGSALDYGTTGRQMGSFGTTWIGGATPVVNTMGSEVKLDGWFYIPNVAALPIPATAGGSGAATVYTFQVATSSASGTKCYLAVNPLNVGGYGTASLDWQKTNNGSTIKLPLYRYLRSTGLAVTDANALNLTGKWLHIVAYAQYTSPAPSWDPNYNHTQLQVTDSSTATVYTIRGTNTGVLSGSGVNVWLGQISGRLSNTPYRGWRGLIDEVKVAGRVHAPMVAYGPTPVSGAIISPSASLMASWVKAAPYNPADTITQDVWVGKIAAFDPNDPNWTKVATGITGTSTSLGAVVMGDTRYWKVDSIDSGTLATTSSAIWSFSVNNIPPIVNLGLDQATYLVGGTRTLSMTPTVTDPDTDPSLLTYAWSQIGGAAGAIIASPSTKNTNITFTNTGPFFFQLTVSDEDTSVSDVIRVEVFATACDAKKAGLYTRQAADFNNDCAVNFKDFASLAANWSKCNSLAPACL